ncbi:MAG: AtpZ/AtpI family protein [Elusimicrobiaceae bacterium]|nr:AtpZ/AtpI family protein [Elusimicrobiaceae bacterium]
MALGPFSKQDHVTITTLGLEFAVAVALGVGVGLWIDKKMSSAPCATIVGMLFGFALGIYIIVKEANRFKEEPKKDKK